MIVYFLNGKIWQGSEAPDNDVHDPLNNYPNIGDFFTDSSTGNIYICRQTGFESQVWDLVNTAPKIQSPASRSLDSAFQVSETRWSTVRYSVDISTDVSLAGGQVGRVILEIASDSGFTTDVQELQSFGNGNTGTLVIGLSLTQLATACLSGDVPPGYYVRLRTDDITGSPTYTYVSGQEVLTWAVQA